MKLRLSLNNLNLTFSLETEPFKTQLLPMYDRIKKPSSSRQPSETRPSQFAPKPFVIQPRLDTNDTSKPVEVQQKGNNATEEPFPILRKMIQNIELQYRLSQKLSNGKTSQKMQIDYVFLLTSRKLKMI